jgi:hypothetical protein
MRCARLASADARGPDELEAAGAGRTQRNVVMIAREVAGYYTDNVHKYETPVEPALKEWEITRRFCGERPRKTKRQLSTSTSQAPY